jgi:hypothetical protein
VPTDNIEVDVHQRTENVNAVLPISGWLKFTVFAYRWAIVFGVLTASAVVALGLSVAFFLSRLAVAALSGLALSGLALYFSLKTKVWLFVLVKMALNLESPPDASTVLCVPPGFNFMDIEGLGRYMFVRPCYVALQNIILVEMIPKNMRRIIVMGIPGIGKTCFLYYVLCELIRQRKRVVFEDFAGLMFMVSAAGRIYTGQRGDAIFVRPLSDRSTFYLFNCGGKPGVVTPQVTGVHAVSIVASSPCKNHTKEFGKAGASKLFMPIWDLEELEFCRQLCSVNLSANQVASRFRMYGGVARPAFFTGKESILISDMDEAIAKFKDKPQDVLGLVGDHDSLQASHRLLHYKVADNFESYTVILASDYVGDCMCDANLKGVVERIRMLQDNDDHGLRGKLFERFSHRILPLGSTRQFPLLMQPAFGGNRVAIPTPISAVPVPINSIADVASKGDRVYLLPTVSNFPVVDALVTPSTGYQMTVSNTHGIAVSSLRELMAVLGCRRFDLVWVVPPDVDFRCPVFTDSTSNILRQFVLKLPLNVPPSLCRVT